MVRKNSSCDEQGFGLVEQIVAMSIFLFIMSIAMSILISIQKAESHAQLRSTSNDQARLAMMNIGRQIRSANYIYDPASMPTPYMELVIYTQVNGTNKCMQWEINNQNLLVRSWYPNPASPGYSAVSAWSPVASNIQNQTLSPHVDAFSFNINSSFGSSANGGKRLIDVNLVVNAGTNSQSAVDLQGSYTGLNIQYGYPSLSCNIIPPG